MKTIIYNYKTGQPLRITTDEVSISDLKNDEDFMPLSMWEEVNGPVSI